LFLLLKLFKGFAIKTFQERKYNASKFDRYRIIPNNWNAII